MKNAMKIFLCLLIVACMALSMVACGGEEKEDAKENNDAKGGESVNSSTVSYGSSTPENAAFTYVDAALKNDPDRVLSALYPNMKGMEDEVNALCEELRTERENNNGTYSNPAIISTTDDSAEIEDAEAFLKENYSLDVKLDELKIVTLRIEATRDEETRSADIDVYVGKIDGTWYVVNAGQ